MDLVSNSSGSLTMAKRKATSLPNETVEYLKAWIMSPDHINHPYPTEAEKVKIMEDTGIEMKQLTNWFVNNRKRYWRPQVAARMKEQRTAGSKVAVSEATKGPARLSPARSNRKSTVEPCGPSTMKTPVKTEVVVTPQRAGTTVSPKPILSTNFSPIVRIISEQNSLKALAELVVSSDDESEAAATCQSSSAESTTAATFKTESIHVYILRPTDGSTMPQLADVSISNTIPSERILRTFENYPVTYSCGDVAKTLRRRDAEIVRVKKSLLSVYYAEILAASASDSPTSSGSKRSALHVVAPDDSHEPLTPRAKYRRMSVELWKEACQTANHVYDQELPSLEEATQLFGYTSS